MNWRERLFGRGESAGIFRNMLTLATGSAAAKAVGLLSIPIITRLYSPEHMGILSTFTAIVAILTPFATLRYVIALPMPKRDSTAANLLVLNIAILFAFTLLLGLVAWGAGPWLLSKLSLALLVPYTPLIILGVSFTAFYEILTLWGTRKKAFRMLAISQTSQALTGSVIKIGLGVVGLKPIGLLIGQLAQQGGGVIALLKLCIRQTAPHRHRIKLARIYKLARQFHDMPQYRLPSHLLLMASMQGPVLFSAQLFGMEIAGQLGLALTALGLPISLLGTTTGSAYFAEISAIGRNEPKRVLEITQSVTKRLLLLSAPPTLVLMVMGPWLFSIVFGSTWRLSGEFARILSIYLAFQFVFSPLGNALTLFRRQDLLFQMNLGRFAMIVAVFITAKLMIWDAKQTVLVYSILLSIHYFISNRVVFKIIRQHIRD